MGAAVVHSCDWGMRELLWVKGKAMSRCSTRRTRVRKVVLGMKVGPSYSWTPCDEVR